MVSIILLKLLAASPISSSVLISDLTVRSPAVALVNTSLSFMIGVDMLFAMKNPTIEAIIRPASPISIRRDEVYLIGVCQ